MELPRTRGEKKIGNSAPAWSKNRQNMFYFNLAKKIDRNESAVLATIIQTQGSAPQVPGATALFYKDGLLDGTLGGGIIEADTQDRAMEALFSGRSQILDFDLTSDTMSAEEAICGGRVKVLVDASPQVHRETFEALCNSWQRRDPGILGTSISQSSDDSIFIERVWIPQNQIELTNASSHIRWNKGELEKALEENKPRLLILPKDRKPGKRAVRWIFLEPVVPFPRLVIAGAGHIGQAVAHLGSLLQFEVTVIDDRPELANKDKIPDADSILVGNIPQAVADFPVTKDTYIVIVTRGHSYDTETLRACISSPAAYIGMIGSRRKIKLIREKFISEAWSTAEEFDRIAAPIGLEIHSKTVEEIAVSIAAQLVLIRSRKKRRGEAG